MDPEGIERKLAAILSADAVGYSRLMATDEVATVHTLRAHREGMAVLVRQHRGRVVDFPGDNLLAEFPSALAATSCAVEIQRSLAARNAELPPERKMEFRIGIHLGDVMIEGERIYGDGVNIAARLEGLAEPGGICISRTVHEQVRHKLAVGYQDLGEKPVKNIPEPIRVYRVRSAPEPVAGHDTLPGMEELTVPGFAGSPAIAVLPFDNMSGDPEQEYFADGISEDLITRLSSLRDFPVIARNSSFVYKGQAVDVKRVSRELGVRYVVEGSVRKAGNRVRVNAQLIEASTGHHVWAERYDRELSDLFAVQDEITEAITASMGPALSRAERSRAVRRAPENLDAWDCLQRSLWHLFRYAPEHNTEAQSWARRALELQPNSAGAFSILAFTHVFEIIYRWSPSPARSQAEAVQAAEQAVALTPDDPVALFALGFACSMAGQYRRAVEVLERAIGLNPSDAMAHWALGAALVPCGCAERAIPALEKAIRLSPHDPWMHEFLFNLGSANFLAGRYDEAIACARRSLLLKADQPGAHRLLAASYGQLGRIDEARASLEALLRLVPDFSAAHLRWFLPPPLVERYLEGLRKAGLED